MQVELDIFSGRPNPVWILDGEAERALLELEVGLLPAGRPSSGPPPLGYRGFIYGNGTDQRRVYGGMLSRSGRQFGDPQHRIEQFLIGHMPAEFGGLIDQLRRQL